MHSALLSLVPIPAAWFIKAVCVTLRVRMLGEDLAAVRQARRQSAIYAFWHGQLLYLMYRYRGSGVHTLVSQSRDGELLSRVLRHFELPTIRGSSSRGGRRGLLALVRQTRHGAGVAIAPDGPRGPRHRAQAGIIGLARLAAVPIIPVAVGARWKVEFQSWDRFILPLPCSRVVIAYGEPMVVPANADAALLEQKRRELESALSKLTDEVNLVACS
jgi:lysophospholipid acyltransferase (LPLAT)-like uncharacterized protein